MPSIADLLNIARFLLNSMVYDKLSVDRSSLENVIALCNAGRIEILQTHIQEDQLARTRDEGRRIRLLGVMHAIPASKVSTRGAAWGLSKWDRCRWSDASGGHIDVADRKPAQHADALLVSTAASEADVFITEDKRLRKRVATLGLRLHVWTFDQFRDYLAATRSISRI